MGTSLMERESPWGALSVADAHVHFFSHGFFSALASQKLGLNIDAIGAKLGWNMPAVEPAGLAGAWVRELDRHRGARAAPGRARGSDGERPRRGGVGDHGGSPASRSILRVRHCGSGSRVASGAAGGD